jgi:GNAT superfamily N-acetyltransferase
MRDHADGRSPDTVSALEIAVDPRWHGHGLSALMLDALRKNRA